MSSYLDRRTATCAILLALSLGPVTAMAGVYRWTDEQGQVHYGQRPPPQGAERLDLPPAGGQVRRDHEAAQRRDRQQRLLESFEHEREQRHSDRLRDEQERQARAERCAELRRRWQTLSYPGRVAIRREGGGREFLSDEQRAEQQQRLRADHVRHCGGEP